MLKAESVYFAFVDILGYKRLLNKDLGQGTLEFKEQLSAAFAQLNQLDPARFQYKSVSDSIFLACPFESDLPDFLRTLRELALSFLESGLFLRGGISYGPHYEDEHITYSLALTQAYTVESTQAIYPRIVIDAATLENFKGLDSWASLKHSGLLLKEADICLLHLLDSETWPKAYAAAKALYLTHQPVIDAQPKIRAKHFWFSQYLQHFTPPEQAPFVPYMNHFHFDF